MIPPRFTYLPDDADDAMDFSAPATAPVFGGILRDLAATQAEIAKLAATWDADTADVQEITK